MISRPESYEIENYEFNVPNSMRYESQVRDARAWYAESGGDTWRRTRRLCRETSFAPTSREHHSASRRIAFEPRRNNDVSKVVFAALKAFLDMSAIEKWSSKY